MLGFGTGSDPGREEERMDIHEAYAIYRNVTARYEEIERIPEIFTDDFVGGNPVSGVIRGVEAQRLFLETPRRMGLVPEDHLSCMIEGDALAFRARVWSGPQGASAFFDAIGHLIFDPAQGKFAFYYGFFDGETCARVLASSPTCSVEEAAAGMEAARTASEARWRDSRTSPT